MNALHSGGFGACLLTAMVALHACTTADAPRWAGRVDTLPSGIVVVRNPARGMWQAGEEWRVVEEVRIGTVEGTGPDAFGDIGLLQVDQDGRIWIFDSQAQELRVFDRAPAYVRTVGRKGTGPGEFEMAIGMDWAPDGTLWVLDPRNNRFSIIDTNGVYRGSKPSVGSIMSIPWPGGFDIDGWLYHYAPRVAEGEIGGVGLVLVRYDTTLTPHDTIEIPTYHGERETFLFQDEHNYIQVRVPYGPDLKWLLTRPGDIWIALTGAYRLVQYAAGRDTTRIITREYEPLPVTDADIDSAIAELSWFVKMGGKVDRTRFPGTKPGLEGFLVDDSGRIWVLPVTRAEDKGRVLDVFDPSGRYLGRVTLPFRLELTPTPIIRGDTIYAVTRDELDVPFVVRARILRT